MLKGKYLDIQQNFEESSKMYKKALEKFDKNESNNVFLKQNLDLGVI